MKKILAIVLAVVMLLPVFAVNVFAADGEFKLSALPKGDALTDAGVNLTGWCPALLVPYQNGAECTAFKEALAAENAVIEFVTDVPAGITFQASPIGEIGTNYPCVTYNEKLSETSADGKITTTFSAKGYVDFVLGSKYGGDVEPDTPMSFDHWNTTGIDAGWDSEANDHRPVTLYSFRVYVPAAEQPDDPVEVKVPLLLEIGDVFGTLKQSAPVDVSEGGEFTLEAALESALTIGDSSFIGVKTTAGNVAQNTTLPDGTTVTVTALELDGKKVELDAAKASKTVAEGKLDGNNGVALLFKMGGLNALTGEVPASFTSVKVTLKVELPGEPAPADSTTGTITATVDSGCWHEVLLKDLFDLSILSDYDILTIEVPTSSLAVGYNDTTDTWTQTDNLKSPLTIELANCHINEYAKVVLRTQGEHTLTWKLSKKASAIVIGETAYETLQEAVEAAKEGDVINVNEDVTGAGAAITAKVTIDLGGHTYTVEAPAEAAKAAPADKIVIDGGELTLKNGTLTGTSEVLIENYGTLTLAEGAVVTAAEGKTAILMSRTAADGVSNVNAAGETVVINGNIVITSNVADDTFDAAVKNIKLSLDKCTVNGDIVVDGDGLKFEIEQPTEKVTSILSESNYDPLYGDKNNVTWEGNTVKVDGNGGILLKLGRTMKTGDSIDLKIAGTVAEGGSIVRAFLTVGGDGASNIAEYTKVEGDFEQTITLTANTDGLNHVAIKGPGGGQLKGATLTDVSIIEKLEVTEPTAEEVKDALYKAVAKAGAVTFAEGTKFNAAKAVSVPLFFTEEELEEKTYSDGTNLIIGQPKKGSNTINGFTFMYVNDDYHAVLLSNGMFLPMPHEDSGFGFCKFCLSEMDVAIEGGGTSAADEVVYNLENVQSQDFSGDPAIADGLALVDTQSGGNYSRIATNWVNGGNSWNGITKAIVDNPDAWVQVRYTGNVKAIVFESESKADKTKNFETTAPAVVVEGEKNSAWFKCSDIIANSPATLTGEFNWANFMLEFEGESTIHSIEVVIPAIYPGE